MSSDNNVTDNEDLKDPVFHRRFILQAQLKRKFHKSSRIVVNGAEGLTFVDGIFNAEALQTIIMPTMKGFWVPIKVHQGVKLSLRFPELIGLKNCAEHVNGEIQIASNKMRSFELVPIKSIFRLGIYDSANLTDLSKLPNVLDGLVINPDQVRGNIRYLINACSPVCFICLRLPSPFTSPKVQKLENLLNHFIRMKGGRLVISRSSSTSNKSSLIMI